MQGHADPWPEGDKTPAKRRRVKVQEQLVRIMISRLQHRMVTLMIKLWQMHGGHH